jgi:uncharacterized protein YjbI with pentapeptide repeats
MATRNELINRWKQEPWSTVDRKLYESIVEYSNRPAESPPPDLDALFDLLDGLPYREEVPSGRDLRASSVPGARGLDLHDTDFSYCAGIASFRDCDLSRARLDQIRGEINRLRGQFVETSFRKAKIGKAWLSDSRFDQCRFDGADLRSANFRRSDLRGSSFREANCGFADFLDCDVRGCDFRGADLANALFRNVKIDETTDLRGANLIALQADAHYDFAGQLVSPATDWRVARWDETTLTGEDTYASDRRLLELVIEAASQEQDPWASRIAERARQWLKTPDQLPDSWDERLIETVDPANREEASDLIQRAFMEL